MTTPFRKFVTTVALSGALMGAGSLFAGSGSQRDGQLPLRRNRKSCGYRTGASWQKIIPTWSYVFNPSRSYYGCSRDYSNRAEHHCFEYNVANAGPRYTECHPR